MTVTETFDEESLRAKYRKERDKRLRPDGNDQYLEPKGRFAYLLEDPYVEKVEREPLFDEVTIAFIGGGFAGLCAGARLKEAGVEDVRIIEGGGDFGGAWYWNRYPGAMCDTAAMVYLPLLEETGHMPTRKYVFADEIFAHAQRIGTQFNLYENALFSTSVSKLEWDETQTRWIIHTDRGDAIRAKFVAMGTGPLQRPKLPGIPGIETFERESFHTSRWNYDYTGGDPTGEPMVNLADKRVGIIGTGATAVQCIPHLARDAGELYVFQRTPSSIDIRNNQPIDPEWFDTLEPGWQKKWLENFATVQTGGLAEEDLVQDGWTDLTRRIIGRVVEELKKPGTEPGPALFSRAYELSDDEKMEEIRARVDSIVENPEAAEALKPWYRQLCKRPCFHDEYLQAYNEPGTYLVDTDGKGVERIDETGVWVDGTHYELDCLIFASGFEVGTPQSRRSGFETFGRDGVALTEHWKDGMKTLHGIHMHNFPNLFISSLAQGGNLLSNVTHNLVESGTTIASIVAHALEIDADEVEVTAEAENEWIEMIQGNPRSFFGNPECTPGYYNNEGQPIGRLETLNAGGYPEGSVAYFKYIDEWRTSGEFKGLKFTSHSE
jgi:cation diffusion facilitator CzcD-associated flavoprotein CzcO|tara:strand:+ start:168 stop:1985 length:1818 start_codon:yes stop_codon:yes gene_type:complete